MSEFIPYISPDDLEALLGADLVNPTAPIVAITLDTACTAVRTYLGQDINLVENDVEFHSGTGRRKLRLRERPVRSVTKIEYVPSGNVVPASSYSVRDAVISFYENTWEYGNDNIKVTYTHGWDVEEPTTFPVPADIRFVTMSLARRLYTDVGEQSAATTGGIIAETIGDYSYQLSDAAAQAAAATSMAQITLGERFILNKYRVELVGDSPTW